jgi:hypothetical protein
MIQPTKQEKWQSPFFRAGTKRRECSRVLPVERTREALFYYWKKRLRGAAVPQFVEVGPRKGKREEAQAFLTLGTTIEVRLGNGRSLVVGPEFSASHLRAVLAVVESESRWGYGPMVYVCRVRLAN